MIYTSYTKIPSLLKKKKKCQAFAGVLYENVICIALLI